MKAGIFYYRCFGTRRIFTITKHKAMDSRAEEGGGVPPAYY